VFSLAKKGQKFKKYPPELKQEVIRLYLEEHLSKKKIASLLSIDEGRVIMWIKNYLTHGNVEMKRGRPKKQAHEKQLEMSKAEEAYLKLIMERQVKEKDKRAKAETIN